MHQLNEVECRSLQYQSEDGTEEIPMLIISHKEYVYTLVSTMQSMTCSM
jgi:hypothetical protein